MIRRHAFPLLAALGLVLAGPHTERFEAMHAPRLVVMLALATGLLATGRVALRDFRAVEWLSLAALGAMAVSAALSGSPACGLRPLALAAACVALQLGAAWRTEERARWLEYLALAVLVVAAIGLAEALGVGPPSLTGRTRSNATPAPPPCRTVNISPTALTVS